MFGFHVNLICRVTAEIWFNFWKQSIFLCWFRLYFRIFCIRLCCLVSLIWPPNLFLQSINYICFIFCFFFFDNCLVFYHSKISSSSLCLISIFSNQDFRPTGAFSPSSYSWNGLTCFCCWRHDYLIWFLQDLGHQFDSRLLQNYIYYRRSRNPYDNL